MLTIKELFEILNMTAERSAIHRIDVCRDEWHKTWDREEWKKVLSDVGDNATVLKMALQRSYNDNLNYLWIKVA